MLMAMFLLFFLYDISYYYYSFVFIFILSSMHNHQADIILR